jgi:hypothetical protein
MISRSRGTLCPRDAWKTCVLMEEGAGNAGCWPHPWPACRNKSRRQSPQVQPKKTGIPRAMVGRLIRALRGDRLDCPRVAQRSRIARGASTGTPGPHDFAAVKALRSSGASSHGHRFPASRVVTIGRTSLLPRRDAHRQSQIPKKRKLNFRAATALLADLIEPTHEISCSARPDRRDSKRSQAKRSCKSRN